MWQFDEQAANLPPPQTEEPANLRRDIVDELADHLTCALKREQCADAPQENQAPQHRVLNRFGDPVAVARKLWFDALWEKIMTQRILIAACLLMAVVTCVALGFAWQSLRHQESMIASWQETSASQLREQKEYFERLLSQSAKNQPPSDWNPVEFRFVSGTPDGPPVPGVEVDLSINDRESGIPQMNAKSDARGVVRFERVRYGTYSINLRAPTQETTHSFLSLQPGEGLTRTFVCPPSTPEPAKVKPRIVWPDDLANRAIWFRFHKRDVYRPAEKQRWHARKHLLETSTDLPFSGDLEPLIEPNGTVHAMLFRDGMTLSSRAFGRGKQTESKPRSILWSLPTVDFRENNLDRTEHPDTIDWPGKEYVIQRLELLVSNAGVVNWEQLNELPDRPDTRSQKRFYVVALESADWGYRIEPGTDGAPGTLWLTPTDAAVETVRKTLTELDQALAESAARSEEKKKELEAKDAAAKDTASNE
jgi:hypothetical protein